MNYLIIGSEESSKTILANKIAGPNPIIMNNIEEVTIMHMFGKQSIIINNPEELIPIFNPRIRKQYSIPLDKIMESPIPDVIIITTTAKFEKLTRQNIKSIHDNNITLIFIQ